MPAVSVAGWYLGSGEGVGYGRGDCGGVAVTFDMNDPIQVYLREVCGKPPLTKDREIELSRHVVAKDSQAELAGKELIESNLAMVVSVAERFGGRGIDTLDLIQRGNDGLLFALQTLSEHPNESFSVHAAASVEAAIACAIAEREP